MTSLNTVSFGLEWFSILFDFHHLEWFSTGRETNTITPLRARALGKRFRTICQIPSHSAAKLQVCVPIHVLPNSKYKISLKLRSSLIIDWRLQTDTQTEWNDCLTLLFPSCVWSKNGDRSAFSNDSRVSFHEMPPAGENSKMVLSCKKGNLGTSPKWRICVQ